MRLDPPDTARAKIALKQYLTDTGGATPSESLSAPRLSLGLLYIQSGQPGDYEQARKWLLGNRQQHLAGSACPCEAGAGARVDVRKRLERSGKTTGSASQLTGDAAIGSP